MTVPADKWWMVGGTLALMGTFTFFGGLIRRWQYRRLPLPAPKSAAIIITGCDSGIGLGVALHSIHKLGLRVIGLVRDPSNSGSRYLKNRGESNVTLIKCDLLVQSEILNATSEASQLLDSWNCRLHALVNNAGVMTMGKLEWQTTRQIEEQITVNFVSPVLLAKIFLPRLRKDSGRVVNVSSHCGLHALPYLSVYSATKSAIDAWSEAIRIEGIPVVTIRPGSYVTQSRILAALPACRDEMWNAMSEKGREIHEEAFNKFYGYMDQIPVSDLGLVEDPLLMDVFEGAFFDKDPNMCYINSPWRYSIYYFLFSMAPTFRIKNFLKKQFVSIPE